MTYHQYVSRERDGTNWCVCVDSVFVPPRFSRSALTSIWIRLEESSEVIKFWLGIGICKTCAKKSAEQIKWIINSRHWCSQPAFLIFRFCSLRVAIRRWRLRAKSFFRCALSIWCASESDMVSLFSHLLGIFAPLCFFPSSVCSLRVSHSRPQRFPCLVNYYVPIVR